MFYDHNQAVINGIDIENNAAAQLALTIAAGATAALDEGWYDVWSDIDCWIRVTTAVAGVTTLTGYKIFAGDRPVPVFVRKGSKIDAIAGASGTLNYHRVG